MRAALASALLVATLLGCGDSTGPNDVFPDVAGVYNVTGSFDNISSSDAHFEGTLTLTQASRASGTLTGSAAYLTTISGDVFNLSDSDIDGASVSTNGVITYTMTQGSGTWTFTGTKSGSSITSGRHTLSNGGDSFSGSWSANRASSSVVAAATRAVGFDALARRLRETR